MVQLLEAPPQVSNLPAQPPLEEIKKAIKNRELAAQREEHYDSKLLSLLLLLVNTPPNPYLSGSLTSESAAEPHGDTPTKAIQVEVKSPVDGIVFGALSTLLKVAPEKAIAINLLLAESKARRYHTPELTKTLPLVLGDKLLLTAQKLSLINWIAEVELGNRSSNGKISIIPTKLPTPMVS